MSGVYLSMALLSGTARALLITPPFIKYAAGPALGPALLRSAGEAAGHEVTLLDLNALFIQERLAVTGSNASRVVKSTSPLTSPRSAFSTAARSKKASLAGRKQLSSAARRSAASPSESFRLKPAPCRSSIQQTPLIWKVAPP